MGIWGSTPAHVGMAARGARFVSREDAWSLLRELALSASRGEPVADGVGVGLDDAGRLGRVSLQDAWIVARPQRERGWDACASITPGAAELLDLYAPLCVGRRAARVVIAHLGQSLDGRISGPPGTPRFITGAEDVEHTHRLRALFDAVVIGAETAAVDDPRLTTRLVPGRHPVRVLLDPRGRLPPGLRVLSDGEADTIAIVGKDCARRHADHGPRVSVIEVGLDGDRFPVRAVLAALRERGLARVFVEGGGVTVSRFLDAAVLDRLHIAVAPKILGAGTVGLDLQPVSDLSLVVGMRCRRISLGSDMLFDCDLRRDDD